ncbi:MAG: alpha/beta hydrolase [Acidimicrobiaceae bacterium]|nr:alpha/beta hydrolase [Acidimicrobiaceae bacterium]
MTEIPRALPQSDAAVVFIHGQPGCAADFSKLVKRLPVAVQFITYDRPGWGESARGVTDVDGNVKYLMEEIVATNYSGVILVGYSYGSVIALRAAIDYPERVMGLVLVSPVGGTGSISVLDKAMAILAKYLQFLPIITRFLTREQRQFKVVQSFEAEQVHLGAELVRLSEYISNIRLPVELIAGMDDLVNPLHGTLELFDLLPNSRLSLIKGAGHLLIIQMPEKIIEKILDMWSGESDR